MVNPFETILTKLETLEQRFDASANIPPTVIIDRAELCKRLNITEPTAIRWGKRGAIPFFTIGSNVRYNWHKVIEALEKRKGGRNG
jgi:hypothetical protein